MAAKKKDGRETSEIEKEEAQLTRVIISVLRAARDDSDVTQEELGRRMGWSKKQMWDLEHGRKTVTRRSLLHDRTKTRHRPGETGSSGQKLLMNLRDIGLHAFEMSASVPIDPIASLYWSLIP